MSCIAKFIRLFPVYAVLVSLSQTIYANDSSYGDNNGTIVLTKQADISMDSEHLIISEKEIKVNYVFTNTSTEDLVVPIVFPMPADFFGVEDYSEITNFKVYANNKPLNTKKTKVVLLDNKIDITKKMQELGWTTTKLHEALRDNELNIRTRANLPASWFDKDGEPKFTLHDYYTWTQTFPARQTLRISHSYTPSLSTQLAITGSEVREYYANDYCMQESSIVTGTNGKKWFEASTLSYILKTAKNWQGPIKNFRLTVQKAKASDSLFLCFDGKLEKTNATTFEFKSTNFIPNEDLKILFLSPINRM